MATGQIQIEYNKYPPTTVSTGISYTRPQLYPRVKNCIRARTRRVSDTRGIYIYIYTLGTCPCDVTEHKIVSLQRA